MSTSFQRHGLGILLATLCASSYGPTADAATPRTRLAVAFPKTYNRVETAMLYGGYLKRLAQCANVELVNLRGEPVSERFDALDLLPESELVTHMRTGRLQLAQFFTGLVPAAIDEGQGEAFAVRGDTTSGRYGSYRLHLIVRADSSYLRPPDLTGTRIAHSSVRSNSGNLAPRALFPAIGLVPERDYEVVYSGNHERSIVGTFYGFWKGAAVASDQFERMVRKGEIKPQDFRVLWASEPFPVEAMVMSRQLAPDVQQRVRQCTYGYRFPAKASSLLDGADGFVPIDAERAFAGVRLVLERTRASTR
ncbi:PhnD/SsuA/transferrin family substrate-binding protein [Aquincola sp. S2]|uniref:PhnD/SsuA/transferrin family substrate-binding protein n=1 Tax=Pseudaquabacterium terrae TaxID=2732868 RepID=A0ABX2E952_9BURK|nr:PhnD/SsuA/transferrin family substrate-binding protein [Aquabacterium terrae]NRF65479.1 PhnD/SsuA/transferrin family substrate-binding protein [Aquabacterium terrae]